MKTILAKISSAVAGAVALLLAFAMAGLGFTVLAFLALIALATLGVALLASPFIGAAQPTAADTEDSFNRATAA